MLFLGTMFLVQLADAIDQVDGMHSFVEGLYTYLVSFTTGEANKVVRNSGDDGLECWRRLNSEYDPSFSMRRVAILGLVQNPPRCKSVDELGSALESWLTKKRQYEEFTDRDGNPCRVSEDSLMAALYKLMPESLEEAVMFRSEDYPSFNDLFDKLTSYASTKHSLFLTKRDLQSHSSSSAKKDPDAMDIGAMSKGKKGDGKKGKTKGKMVCYGCGKVGHKLSECRSSGNGKGKGGDRIDMVKCWNCDGYGHYGKDCPSRFKGKSGGKPKGGGRAFGKKADDKGKGKGGKSANAVDESNTQEAATAELGFLDLCACSNSVESHLTMLSRMLAKIGLGSTMIVVQQQQWCPQKSSCKKSSWSNVVSSRSLVEKGFLVTARFVFAWKMRSRIHVR